MLRYDVVWVWNAHDAEWRACTIAPKSSTKATNAFARKIARQHEEMGFVANVGRRDIGPPEGPPSAERLKVTKRV